MGLFTVCIEYEHLFSIYKIFDQQTLKLKLWQCQVNLTGSDLAETCKENRGTQVC